MKNNNNFVIIEQEKENWNDLLWYEKVSATLNTIADYILGTLSALAIAAILDTIFTFIF